MVQIIMVESKRKRATKRTRQRIHFYQNLYGANHYGGVQAKARYERTMQCIHFITTLDGAKNILCHE